MRLVQFFKDDGARGVGLVEESGNLLLVNGFHSVYEMALAAIRNNLSLSAITERNVSAKRVDYDALIREQRILPPVDHPDTARCLVSLTGLTHLGSAKARDKLHATSATESDTDSIRMFKLGLAGGKPAEGEIGCQPEWAYKGDGRCIVAPEHPLTQPAFAEDGGEEGEIAGLYVIDETGNPWRIGFALGNEFSDHVTEKKNYLYLAHSKLRQCSIGPELTLGPLPGNLLGTVRVVREGQEVWRGEFQSGEANMCHSIANLERHHFKYELFRRPGDIHVHFFGASAVSFGSSLRTRSGDVFEIDVPQFGRPLRNPLQVEDQPARIPIRSL